MQRTIRITVLTITGLTAAALIVVLLILTGCTQNPKPDPVIGTWREQRDGVDGYLVIEENGHVHFTRDNGQPGPAGHWRLEGSRLHFTMNLLGRDVTTTNEVTVTDKFLTLKHSGKTVLLHRSFPEKLAASQTGSR